MEISDKEGLDVVLENLDDEVRSALSTYVERTLSEKEEAIKQRNNTVEEIKSLRKKNQELEATKPPIDLGEAEKVVREVLDKEKQSKFGENQKKALNKFWQSNPEFHPDNDASGAKSALLNEALKRVNTAGHYEIDEIMDDYNFALSNIKKPETPSFRPSASTPSSEGSPRETLDKKEFQYSSDEEKLLKGLGVDKEKVRQNLSK